MTTQRRQSTYSVLLMNWDLAGGGAERQLAHLACAWAGFFSEPFAVVVLAGGGALLGEVATNAPVISLSRQRPRRLAGQFLWALASFVRLVLLMRRHRPAAVLSFLPLPTMMASFALRCLPQRPTLIWSVQSDLLNSYGKRALKRLVLLSMRRSVLPKVDLFIAPSQGIRQQLEQSFGISSQRIRVIPNAVRTALGSGLWALGPDGDSPRTEGSRGSPGSSGSESGDQSPEPRAQSDHVLPKRGRFRILAVGRCAAPKGYPDLLIALSEMRHRDAELVLLGDGPLRPALEQMARRLGVADRIHFAGFVTDIYPWLTSADVFVSASLWETFGIAIAEAMACGLPVVATTTDGARDLIRSMETGILVERGQPSRLAAAVDRLLDDEELRGRLGRAAAARVGELEVSRIARRYTEAISAALATEDLGRGRSIGVPTPTRPIDTTHDQ